MQKLRGRRSIDTPVDIPHVCSSIAQRRSDTGDRTTKTVLPLSSPKREGDSVVSLTTSLNDPDAALTLKGGNMQVYVLNHKGRALMPCQPRKARLLLKQGKAKVITRTSFTIQWVVPTRSFCLPVTLGVDSGYTNIGLSAVTATQELYASETALRTDIVKLNFERSSYRRTRRNRLWYRQTRFDKSRKSEGWLAPSIQHKLNTHLKFINEVQKMLPITSIVVEVAAFDIQKIKDPQISGVGYQNGPQKDFWNAREYVLYRDGHVCTHCRGKSKDKRLHVHHIESRQTGGDRPANLRTICQTCHTDYHNGHVTLRKLTLSKGFKAETFMSSVWWQLVDRLKKATIPVTHTYGYLTKASRTEQGIQKSHINDAFAIASGMRPIH